MTARHASASVPMPNAQCYSVELPQYLLPASGILSPCLPKRDVGWKAAGRAGVRHGAFRQLTCLCHPQRKVNYSMNKRVHLGRPSAPTTRRRDARASEGQDRPMMAGRSQLERPEGVVIRPIKRSRVGEAFWISADRGMGGFGRGCDRLWMGGQGGLVAHLVLALEL